VIQIDVEIQDILFTSTGPTAGLVAVEWNLPMDNTATASAAMWGRFSVTLYYMIYFLT
jgi:hypothetical protein